MTVVQSSGASYFEPERLDTVHWATGFMVDAPARPIRSSASFGQDGAGVRCSQGTELQAPYKLVKEEAAAGKLPVVLFTADGIATPADAAMMMQVGADGVFVGSSGIFKSGNPAQRLRCPEGNHLLRRRGHHRQGLPRPGRSDGGHRLRRCPPAAPLRRTRLVTIVTARREIHSFIGNCARSSGRQQDKTEQCHRRSPHVVPRAAVLLSALKTPGASSRRRHSFART
jgi:hypothetical protein